jgi:hypothetical protein
MTEKPTVFLSYAREDRARVEQVYDSLRAEGFEPWMDSRDIMAGQEWSSVIGQTIQSADFVLVFISRHSVSKGGYVQRELRAALSLISELPQGAIFLIPVRLDDSMPPEALRAFQFVDLFEDKGWEKLLRGLRLGMERGRILPEPMRALKDEIHKEEMARPRGRRHVFVAMPFAVEMEDVYYYGIERAIDANGFQSVRVDKSAFTGDILEKIKQGIHTAAAAVVELTGSNSNVHLELGYAWGRSIPTVLLLREGGDLCFDVRGQKCLTYRTIKDLEVSLTAELRRLKENGDIPST